MGQALAGADGGAEAADAVRGLVRPRAESSCNFNYFSIRNRGAWSKGQRRGAQGAGGGV